MKVLVTGKGSAGSWKIRGEQLGGAIGATVVPKCQPSDCEKAVVIVAVKRLNAPFFNAIQQSRKPWVWDLVDFYPQPFCTQWNKNEAIKWVQKQIDHYKPDGVVWPNQKMRDDCDIGTPGVVVYHHHRQNIGINPIREQIKRVGYEGEPSFLGEWMDVLISECNARQWDLMLNPPKTTDLDVIFAFRGDHVNGYAQRNWKSNIKLSNAQGSGTPFVGAPEASYIETNTGGVCFVDGKSALNKALNSIVLRETRQEMSRTLLDGAYSVDDAARDLREFVELVGKVARK